MDFEIEDDDDPYDFQSNWSKPSAGKAGGFGFGFDSGKGGNTDDDDAYNYDFGTIKEETTHYSGKEKSSKKQEKPAEEHVEKEKPKPVTGGNAMEKAAAMLNRYSGKDVKKSAPVKSYKSTSMDFDEDDISISMGSDDSYEDSYPKKVTKKQSSMPDSPLNGGLDSDIPRMKKNTFQAPSIAGAYE
jgi:hypothetical protein